MKIVVNGEAQTLPAGSSIRALLQHLHLGDRRVAVELNGRIVPRSQHEQTVLAENDQLLVVQAIGGG